MTSLISIMLHPRRSKVCVLKKPTVVLVERKWNSFLWTSNDDDKLGSCDSTFLLFLQRWRRRWFVLQQGKLPRQYLLNYYTDESKKRLKGSIALDECEQVTSYFDVKDFPFIEHWGKNPQFIQKFTFWKYLFSQNSHFQSRIFHKIHISKSHFSQNSQFQSRIFLKIHIFQTSNSG